jgi:hypothetical protein
MPAKTATLVACIVLPLTMTSAALAQTPSSGTAKPDAPANAPVTGPNSGTSPENAGSTGWSGGTGGSNIGTSPHAPTPASPTQHPATATGVDPTKPEAQKK